MGIVKKLNSALWDYYQVQKDLNTDMGDGFLRLLCRVAGISQTFPPGSIHKSRIRIETNGPGPLSLELCSEKDCSSSGEKADTLGEHSTFFPEGSVPRAQASRGDPGTALAMGTAYSRPHKSCLCL